MTIESHFTLLFHCSSLFREMEKYEKDFPEWCNECAHEKKEKESQSLDAKRKVIKKRRHDDAQVYKMFGLSMVMNLWGSLLQGMIRIATGGKA